MVKLFLGVDGGGTQTKAAIIDQVDKIVSTNWSSGTNVNIFGWQQSLANLKEVVKQVLGDLKYDQLFGCIALAGVNFDQERQNWQKAIATDSFLASVFSQPPLIINDTQAALRAGTTEKNAVVVIAGTGSACYGRNENGQEAKSGGLDYLLSDQGSGFWLGLKILKAATASLDGRAKPTILTDLVFAKLQVDSLEELYHLVYDKPWDKTDIAQLAFLAEEAASKSDEQAIKIIEEAAKDLTMTAKAVIEKLGLTDKSFVLVKAGSILKLGGLVCQQFEQNLKKATIGVKFVDQDIEPSVAAALIANEHFQA